MSTLQRRRGELATFYKSEITTNNRGAKVRAPEPDPYMTERVSVMEDRSTRAEVPGQQEIDLVHLYTSVVLGEAIDPWAIVWFRGAWWDVVAPPSIHNSISKAVRHADITIRRRTVAERVERTPPP